MYRLLTRGALAFGCLVAVGVAMGDGYVAHAPPAKPLLEVIPDLIATLRGRDANARNQAIRAIGHMASNAFRSDVVAPAINPAYRERWRQAQEADRARRTAILDALVPAVPILSVLVDDANPLIKSEAI
jgi:hypothetical protein